MKWLSQYTIYRDKIDLVAVIDRGGDTISVGKEIEMTLVSQPRNNEIPGPTISLDKQSASSLMQALWDAGIRPANLPDASGEIRALRAHVEFAQRVAGSLIDRGE